MAVSFFKRQFTPFAPSLLLATCLLATAFASGKVKAQSSRTPARMPQYDETGALRLPPDYRQWVLAGTSKGLSYSDGQPGMEMFNETLIEPTAYAYFAQTGSFREGTMLALILHGIGEQVMPARRGTFASEIHGVDVAVKDHSHRREGWAYYGFGDMNGIKKAATAMPTESCYSCHAEHAKRDNVFLQFYSLLAEAAPAPKP
jgi:cytochrome P460